MARATGTSPIRSRSSGTGPRTTPSSMPSASTHSAERGSPAIPSAQPHRQGVVVGPPSRSHDRPPGPGVSRAPETHGTTRQGGAGLVPPPPSGNDLFDNSEV